MTHHTHPARPVDLIDGDVVTIATRTYAVVGVPVEREDGVVVLTADAEHDGVQHTFHLGADRVYVLCALDHPDLFADAAADATGPAAGAEHVPTCSDAAPCERRACDACYARHGADGADTSVRDDALRADAATLIDGALADGGSTVWLVEPRTTGFLVGIPAHGTTVTEDQARSAVPADAALVAEHAAAWLHRVGHAAGVATAGSWLDGGTVYLDACDYHADARSALDAAAERGERAVWDLSGDGREVRADGTVAASDVRVGDLILPTFDGGMRPGIPVRVTSIRPAHATPGYVRFTLNGRVSHPIPDDARVRLDLDADYA